MPDISVTNKYLLGSTSIGMTVNCAEGDAIGTLRELVLSHDRYRVVYGIVAVRRLPAISAALFVIPWDQFEVDEEQMTFRLPVSADYLKDAPGFDEANWADLSQLCVEAETSNFYGLRPFWPARLREQRTIE